MRDSLLTLASAGLLIEKYVLFVDVAPWEEISFIVARTLFLWDEMIFHGGDESRVSNAKSTRTEARRGENYGQEASSTTTDTSKSINRKVDGIEDRHTRSCIHKSIDALKPTDFADFVVAFDSLMCFGR